MGYYTYYSLNVEDEKGKKLPKEKLDAIAQEIERLHVFEDGNVEDGYNGYAKWYDFEQDMCALSYKFPGVLFSLYGGGEDSADMWVEYFLEGSCQYERVEIRYESFDHRKLCPPNDQSVFSPNRKYSYEVRIVNQRVI